MTDEPGRLAAEAVAAWGGVVAPPVLIQDRENAVFRARLTAGPEVALRLHRAGYNDGPGIAAELGLCEALAASGFSCPRPLRTRAGGLVHRLGSGRLASMVGWIAGRPLSDVPAAELPAPLRWQAVGRLLAEFHRGADRLPPLPPGRPGWGAAALTGAGIWGDPLEDPALGPQDRAVLAGARAAAGPLLASLEAGDLGLIHGDPLPDNMMLAAQGLVLIDFDDCGPGVRVYDLAVALVGLAGRPEYDPAAAALCDGYRAAGGPASAAALAALPVFVMLRAQASAAWSRSRCAPGDPRRAAYRDRALRLSRALLSSPLPGAPRP
ncbi:phosphotransferase enzyme family protein [Mangrovicoccus algicola]|uniref:Phosphotransferase n=1 Tax=Mangrovicoccus algicola TaxID=2771008 RepID=A0A8J6YYG0_9RHOB|nr:phosphotransferase [Mangrovicoccus algicola]MBE3640117.1 phosphotransferase [Mangrovicoccus algicola]